LSSALKISSKSIHNLCCAAHAVTQMYRQTDWLTDSTERIILLVIVDNCRLLVGKSSLILSRVSSGTKLWTNSRIHKLCEIKFYPVQINVTFSVTQPKAGCPPIVENFTGIRARLLSVSPKCFKPECTHPKGRSSRPQGFTKLTVEVHFVRYWPTDSRDLGSWNCGMAACLKNVAT